MVKSLKAMGQVWQRNAPSTLHKPHQLRSNLVESPPIGLAFFLEESGHFRSELRHLRNELGMSFRVMLDLEIHHFFKQFD